MKLAHTASRAAPAGSRLPRAWERERAAVSRAAACVTPWLTGHAELRPAQTVLELACGTGETGMRAAAIVGPGGRVIETDQAPAMVEAALRSAADLGLDNVEARVMDAERLELPDASVDAVVCRWGLMLMADPAACLAEVLRVLRPGGRLAAVVWGAPEDNPWPAVVLGVLIEEGLIQPSGPESGPGIFALATRRGCATWSPAPGSPASWSTGSRRTGSTPTRTSTGACRRRCRHRPRGRWRRLDDDRLARIRRRVDEKLAPYRTADGLVLPGVSLGVAAHRPL